VDLRGRFLARLGRAEEDANDALDAILSEGQQPLVTRADLALRHRELASEAEVEALVNQIRSRLLEPIRAGARVRLI
jgi:hypothetical protein